MTDHGSLDGAVNNAGTFNVATPVDELTVSQWHHVLSLNLDGAFHCVRAEAAVMRKQGAGSIVNIASISGLIGLAGMAPYVASKHGVIGLSRAAALDLAPHGVRVNAVAPGTTRTSMLTDWLEADPGTGGTRPSGPTPPPLGDYAAPEDIAEAALWLCSTRSRHVTGHTMVVDGGRLTR